MITHITNGTHCVFNQIPVFLISAIGKIIKYAVAGQVMSTWFRK